jgi:surface carbohydrate biosynthesis protein
MEMKSKFVCYVQYEIENRELRSRFFFALRLLNISKTVVIFQHSQLHNIALFATPGIIFLKSTPIQNDFLVEHLVKRGFVILAWQEEGIHHNNQQLESPVFSKYSSRFITKYFAWHPADAEFAVRQGIDPNRISISGNIRMELANSLLENTGRKRGRNKLRILILTNFDTSQLSYEFKNDGNISTETASKENELIAKYKSIADKNSQLYRDMVNHKEASNYEFIIRPYIFEKKIFTHELSEVDKNNSIFETFKSIDLVLHYGSTAGIEGIVAGKLSLILTNEIGVFDNRILNSSKLFTNCESLFEYLSKISKEPTFFEQECMNQKKLLLNNYNFNFSNSTHSLDALEFISQLSKVNHNLNNVKGIFRTFSLVYFAKIKNNARKIKSKSSYKKSTSINYVKAQNELRSLNANEEVTIGLKNKGKIIILSKNKIKYRNKLYRFN